MPTPQARQPINDPLQQQRAFAAEVCRLSTGPGGGLWRSKYDSSLLIRTILSVLDRHATAIVGNGR